MRRISMVSLLVTLSLHTSADARAIGPLGPERQYFVFELVAATGEQAPGAPLGATFKDFRENTGRPVLNDNGDLAFQAFLEIGSGGVTVANDVGIWRRDRSGSLALLARKGDQAGSGLPMGATFQDFSIPLINNHGEVAFQARLTQSPGGVGVADDEGIWTAGAEQGPELIAREGDPAIGVPPNTRYSGGFTLGFFDDFRGAHFSSDLRDGSSITEAIYGPDASGGLSLLAREGDPAPGTGGAVFASLPFLVFGNSIGDTAIHATLQIGVAGVHPGNRTGLWAAQRGGTLQLRARAGDPAPGTPGGATFGSFPVGGVLNDLGELAFRGSLQVGAGGVHEGNDTAIWGPDGGGGLAVIAREGEAAPGAPPGAVFTDFSTVNLGERGVAFRAIAETPQGDRLFGVWGPGAAEDITLVLGTQSSAPQLESGARFVGFSDPLVNDRGDVVFTASVLGADAVEDSALFFAGFSTPPRLVLRSGDGFELGPEDVREVRGWSIFSGFDPHLGLRQLNDASPVRLALLVLFTDSSAAILSARPSMCDDGLDNDGDTLVDHPEDPGCGSAQDDSELPETMQLLGDVFDPAAAAGTLIGAGPGRSGLGRLEALRNMIRASGHSMEKGKPDTACQQLRPALLRVDGQPAPPDFATGPALADVFEAIHFVLQDLGCPHEVRR